MLNKKIPQKPNKRGTKKSIELPKLEKLSQFERAQLELLGSVAFDLASLRSNLQLRAGKNGKDGIRLACSGSVTLYADDTEQDTSRGQDVGNAARAAENNAEKKAKEQVKEDLEAQLALVKCEDGCHPVPYEPVYTTIYKKNINYGSSLGGLYVWATSEAKVKGTQKVLCSKWY